MDPRMVTHDVRDDFGFAPALADLSADFNGSQHHVQMPADHGQGLYARSVSSSDGFSTSSFSVSVEGDPPPITAQSSKPLAGVGKTIMQNRNHQPLVTAKTVPEDPTTNFSPGYRLGPPGPSTANSSECRDWDIFRLLPPKPDLAKGVFYDFCLQLLKLSAFAVLFALTLSSAVLAKSTFLLMASGIGYAGRNMSICTDKIPEASKNVVFISSANAAKWAWALLLALCTPELLCFVRCFHRTMFRTVKRPTIIHFFTVFCVESLNAFGIGALAFGVMPHVSAITVVMLSNSLCLVPSLLTALSRRPNRWLPCLLILDVAAIGAQSTVYWAWPRIVSFDVHGPRLFLISVSTTFISLSWWQNFVHPHSFLGPIRWLAVFAGQLRECRSKTYVTVSLWKCMVYVFCMIYFLNPKIPLKDLLHKDPFGERLITITAIGLNQSQIESFQQRMQDFERLSYRLPEPARKGERVVEEVDETEWAEEEEDHDKKQSKIKSKVKEKQNKPLRNQTKSVREERKKKGLREKEKGKSAEKQKKEKMIEGGSEGDQKGIGKGRERRAVKAEYEEEESIAAYNIYEDFVELNQFTTPYDALWAAFFQIMCTFLCYHSSKFACKVMMQRSGFALPMALAVPATVALLSNACSKRWHDPCYLTSVLSKELFWQCPAAHSLHTLWSGEFWTDMQAMLWLAWFLTQLWVTAHLWTPEHERLAKSEKLFILSYFNAAFPDQSLALNRRRDDKTKIRSEDLDMEMDFEGSDIGGAGGGQPIYYESMLDGNGMVRAPPSLCSVSSSKLDAGLIRDNASAADGISKIYVCATMWHESPFEQFNLLKSLFRLDEDQCARRNAQKYLKVVDPDYYEFEAHIFFDDAIDQNVHGETSVNKYVRQLIEKIDEAASAVHQTQMQLRTPKICATPYGGRISFILPGKNRFTVHLKDKTRIRHRKRWSQVMYLYYLLGYRLMLKVADPARREVLAENTYILTLDGDVDFQPECVHLLVDLMKKNRRLGAACGRIHPRGSGLMIWYQKFEYAVGHWLQKATEHMIGCVLCSPGCFSLFRSYALMDDNVTRKYATKSDKPMHYVQYDQGEDRWLCTLLLQRGYRVEYCAASDALTFAPEGFNEFFNQRRRWIPSTLANIIDLLHDYRNVVAVNESVSIWYIIYQFIMLVSSVLGPGTIFLMVVGAISISFNIDTRLALLIVSLPVVSFCVCCLTCTTEKQLLLAQLIGALFAMLMTAVIVGTSLQIQKDGIMSPHSIFLFAVLGSWTVAALLHPLEFTCILPCVLYFLAIPCMYMLLPVYSLTNLNNGTWGTREDKLPGKKSNDLSRANAVGDEDEKARGVGGGGQVDGEVSVGCGSLCRLVCCVRSGSAAVSVVPPKNQVWSIGEGLREISRKLDNLEGQRGPSSKAAKTRTKGARRRRRGEESAGEGDGQRVGDSEEGTVDGERKSTTATARNNAVQENWLHEDKLFRRFERYCLDGEEESFWTEMIEKYLQPIPIDDPCEAERIHRGLTELRNKTCSAFFMINAVFIIVVLVLQMQKDCLHIEWPLGPKINHTVVPCHSESQKEVWVMSRLQLEPMGLVFLVFFMSILIIQFFAMLMHRFGTLAHIIASTELFCFRKSVDRLDEDELVVQNAVEIARELQAIRGVDQLLATDQPMELNMIPNSDIDMRRVVQGGVRSMGVRPTETLDAAFKKRFFALSSSEIAGRDRGGADRERRLTLRRGTIRALEQRRNSLYGAANIEAGNKNLGYFPGSSDSEDQSLEGAARRRATSPSPPPPPPHGHRNKSRPHRNFRLDQLFQRTADGPTADGRALPETKF